MPQHELNRRVAMATGETVGEIARMGFQIDGPPSFTHTGSEDLTPIDWDERAAMTRSIPHRCGRGRVALHQ